MPERTTDPSTDRVAPARDLRPYLIAGVALALLVALSGLSGPGWITPGTAFLALTVALVAMGAVLWFLAMQVRVLHAALRAVPYPGEREVRMPNAAPAPATHAKGPIHSFTERGEAWQDTHVLHIEGIGERTASRLHALGVATVGDLVRADAGRLAMELDIAADEVHRWQSMGNLTRVRGVGPQYAEVLVDAGIRSVEGLARSDSVDLLARIHERAQGRRTRLQGNDIGAGTVHRWVEAAQEADGTAAPSPQQPQVSFGTI